MVPSLLRQLKEMILEGRSLGGLHEVMVGVIEHHAKQIASLWLFQALA